MKVSPQAVKEVTKQKFNPPLPLEVELPSEEDETKMTRFKLRTTPTDVDSPTYSFTMRKLDGGKSLRQAIQFAYDMPTVITGLNITTATNKKAIYLQVLSGPPLTNFNAGYNGARVNEHARLRTEAYATEMRTSNDRNLARQAYDGVAEPPDHDDFIANGVCAILTYVAPHKALAKQKRWMRCFCRKPANMSVREYTNSLLRINERELHWLPPYAPDQLLTSDELVDIVLHGVPRAWTQEMEKQDFNPDEKNLIEVIQFCERMEEAEDFHPDKNNKKTTQKPKADKKEKSSSSEGPKHCLLHGDNYTHTTNECHVLKKQAKSLRHQDDDDRKPPYKNKSWKRDAEKGTSSSKKELAAFVRKQARKELHAFAKKRKASSSEDDEEGSAGSLHNLEAGEIDLAAFNYSEMDDLKIDSDDDTVKSTKDKSEVSV